ncbi:DEAD/DEAH box helicase [Fictibacillus sp. 5RED26]|uniref:DEAD/DEAH box helicase n=1 Tax=Fictibacillus sp. 5RED26 TaxID=2745876 RepID=UPI0018CED280|nr:DEAD/DEAH box helicase [Fictibacillus sp. 5RED26]MBH0158665.1 DEAD/DEAH box helicase [Fictibacillus sp. 5RED26]
MLNIRYRTDKHMAQLSMEVQSPAWGEIRRICIEHSKDVYVSSGNSLEIPWWAFLNCKDSLRLTFRKYKVLVTLDPIAERLIQDSLRKKANYKEASKIGSVLEQDVVTKLSNIGFRRQLSPEQLRNVSKLAALTAGATFSVPGAGKTTEALALYFLKRTKNTRLLIVAPKNAFAAWEEQLGICDPTSTDIVRLKGGEKAIRSILSENPKIMLITYQQLPNVIDIVGNYIDKYPAFLFLDESHRIKRGNDGVIGKSILSISHIPEMKLIMSGTPMPNSSSDLIPQFNFLYPEVRVDTDSVVELINPIYVRTTKDELGLKKPNFKLTPVSMSVGQKRLYELLKSEEARHAVNIRAIDRNRLRSMGRSIMTMLQLVSNPALLLKADFQHDSLLKDLLTEGDSPKIRYVCKKVRELASQGRKTIVWSNFVENVELLALRLKDLGADYIHGGVDAGSEDETDTREAKIKRFHDDPQCFVLIANPAAASEGISLHTVCHDAIYLDRNYNAAHFLQSVDRIHRFGLSKEIDTNVEIVFCPETIDESVEKRLQSKINKMAAVLDDKSLQIEPEYGDEEIMGDEYDRDDIQDFINHLREI